MKRLSLNKNGSTLIVALAVMVVLAAGAVTVVQLSGTDTRSYTDDMQSSQALAVGNGGLQWAINKIANGEDATVADKAFAAGRFSVITDPASSLVTVTSQVGDAKKTQSVNTNFARNCVGLIVSSSYIDGAVLVDTKLTKTCNNYAVIDKLLINWNWSECATSLNCSGVNIDDINNSNEVIYETVGDPGRNKFWICHVPSGNTDNQQTISVPMSAWVNAHSAGQGEHAHDYLGPCIISQMDGDDGESGSDSDDSTGEETVTCLSTNESAAALTDCTEDDGDAVFNKVTFEGSTTIFQPNLIPAATTSAAHSGEDADLLDTVLATNSTYHINTQFDKTIPSGAWFHVTVEFADGSTLTSIVKAGEQPAPIEVQNAEAGNTTTPTTPTTPAAGFTVDNGTITVNPTYTVKLDVLGSAITCGAGGPEVNVRTKACINGPCTNLWSYGDVDGGETYSLTTTEITNIVIEANAYLSSCNNFSSTYNTTNTVQVKTLRNGEQAPSLAGFGGQQSVQYFLTNYLDATGKAMLDANQAIMLFELGTNATSASSAADFQDLVMLMTVTQ